jgi:hypothetical protein
MAIDNDNDTTVNWWIEQIGRLTPYVLDKVEALLMKTLWERWSKSLTTREIKHLIKIIRCRREADKK